MIKRLSHLGFAVQDLEAALDLYQGAFGASLVRRFDSERDGMRAALIKLGDLEIELMQPTREDSPVGKFIAKRGEGVHHVSYEVDDVGEALQEAAAAGLELVDAAPRSGGGGTTRVAFIHPKSTLGVLTELEDHGR